MPPRGSSGKHGTGRKSEKHPGRDAGRAQNQKDSQAARDNQRNQAPRGSPKSSKKK